MTPYDRALYAQQAYADPAMLGVQDSAARAIYKDTVDGRWFAIPGTNNLACALADADVQTIMVQGLGRLHAGFWAAARSLIKPLWPCLPEGPYELIGHSEGAALALILGAYGCLFGRPPAAIWAFEPPRVTCDDTMELLFEAHGIAPLMTRNGNDIVTQVPVSLPMEDWQVPGVLTAIGQASDPYDNVTDHEMARVAAAMLILQPAAQG